MAHNVYTGLGSKDSAVREFDKLTPWVREMMALRAACPFGAPAYMAMSVPLDGLQTTAYHFTRRPDFYFQLAREVADQGVADQRLADPDQAKAAFRGLRPYRDCLRAWQDHCRPFGRDYCALDIAILSFSTAVFHFTRDPYFYGGGMSRSDSQRAP